MSHKILVISFLVVTQVCVDTMGSFSCECALGWTPDGYNMCQNINEVNLKVTVNTATD